MNFAMKAAEIIRKRPFSGPQLTLDTYIQEVVTGVVVVSFHITVTTKKMAFHKQEIHH
jgi:hypothetical protein